MFSPNNAGRISLEHRKSSKILILSKPMMLEKAIVCKLFLRGYPFLISTNHIPLEQPLSQLHLNYVPYFCLQSIPDSFVFPSFFLFLETWPFSQCIHECTRIIISLWNISDCGCLERFVSKICAWARNKVWI